MQHYSVTIEIQTQHFGYISEHNQRNGNHNDANGTRYISETQRNGNHTARSNRTISDTFPNTMATPQHVLYV